MLKLRDGLKIVTECRHWTSECRWQKPWRVRTADMDYLNSKMLCGVNEIAKSFVSSFIWKSRSRLNVVWNGHFLRAGRVPPLAIRYRNGMTINEICMHPPMNKLGDKSETFSSMRHVGEVSAQSQRVRIFRRSPTCLQIHFSIPRYVGRTELSSTLLKAFSRFVLLYMNFFKN